MEKKLPEIIRAEEKDKEQVKSVLKLGFSNDDLLRWVFPSANSFLKSFDLGIFQVLDWWRVGLGGGGGFGFIS